MSVKLIYVVYLTISKQLKVISSIIKDLHTKYSLYIFLLLSYWKLENYHEYVNVIFFLYICCFSFLELKKWEKKTLEKEVLDTGRKKVGSNGVREYYGCCPPYYSQLKEGSKIRLLKLD